ncbi:DUF4097 family beta strand repeat-containing protein [Sphingobacterium yanglingense]|uniref:Adhesin n=1 Tax=Sphingobacterium yanglingense TaxID=1437280 RepID=A0A4R6WET2_9SPHI|nr:hypothetical protein [Sphingobacterium yanglingense]TDQ76507.1 hypothetical protein CLV99_3100 [Sphingobacterium yanglingense]
MYKLIKTIILLFIANFAIGQQMLRKETFDLNKVKELTVNTTGGQIKVDGTKSGSASVEIWVSRNGMRLGSSDNLEALLKENFDINIDLQGGKLVATAKRKNGQRGNSPISVAFHVIVPQNINTSLQTAGGSINLNTLSGVQNFQTSGGSLNLKTISGQINGQTSGGSINATDCDGTIQLTTSGGSINLDRVTGKIAISTSGGSINGKKLSGSIQGQTSGGSITMDMQSVSNNIALSTAGGSIRINVPQGKYDIDLKGSRVELPSSGNFNGTSKKTFAQGTINGGGTKISASTSGGSVSLDFK